MAGNIGEEGARNKEQGERNKEQEKRNKELRAERKRSSRRQQQEAAAVRRNGQDGTPLLRVISNKKRAKGKEQGTRDKEQETRMWWVTS